MLLLAAPAPPAPPADRRLVRRQFFLPPTSLAATPQRIFIEKLVSQNPAMCTLWTAGAPPPHHLVFAGISPRPLLFLLRPGSLGSPTLGLLSTTSGILISRSNGRRARLRDATLERPSVSAYPATSSSQYRFPPYNYSSCPHPGRDVYVLLNPAGPASPAASLHHLRAKAAPRKTLLPRS